VKICRGHPPKLGRDRCTLGQKRGQLRTMVIGQRQPEESPNRTLYRGLFFQWSGAQELGGVGRKP
jgi:hypothetical protein